MLLYISSSPLCVGNRVWGGMSSFQPGWLSGSNLDNAQVVFTCVIVGGWVMFDGEHVNDVIPVSMVCGTGVFVLWYLLGFGVGGSSKAQGMVSRVVGFQWPELLYPISRCSVIVLQLFVPFEGAIESVLCSCITLWNKRSNEIDSSQDFGQRISTLCAASRVWIGMVWSHIAGGGVAFEQGIAQCSGWAYSCIGG